MLRRGAITGYIARHDIQWELGMGLLTAVYVVMAFIEDEVEPGLNAQTIVVLAVAAIFLTEFTVRLWDSPSRIVYLRHHWLDAITCIPMIGALRVLRFARLLRFVRIAALVRAFLVGRQIGADDLGARVGWLLGPTLVIYWAASAYGFWLVEHGRNVNISSYGDALYLSFLTATTLGYGDVKPETPEGKIIAGLVIFAAIGLVGFASAQLTAYWLGQEADSSATKRRLFSVQKELAVQRNMLEQVLEHVSAGHESRAVWALDQEARLAAIAPNADAEKS
jgi:voltage-gated potassium channel